MREEKKEGGFGFAKNQTGRPSVFGNRLNSSYFLPVILILAGCSLWPFGEKWERNPGLELLVRDDSCCFFNPVWSPDGRHIYYLRAHRKYATSPGAGGELWKINVDTKEKRFLLKGPFFSLAISPDGDLLALSYATRENERGWIGGPLILVDTAGNIRDTLPTGLPLILDVEFNLDGSKLYYYAYDPARGKVSSGFYAMDWKTGLEKLVKEDSEVLYHMKWRLGFDLKDDSLIYGIVDSDAYPGFFFQPRVFLKGDSCFLIFFTGCANPSSEIMIANLSSHTSFVLDADPYGPPETPSGFESADWSPDGEKLVISVGEVQGGCPEARVKNLELWILHNVWESVAGGEK